MTTATPAPAPEEHPAADDRLAGLLAEQNHQFHDLDRDSACCLPGFSCPACPPAGEVTA